ncbi:hypothetical protein [Halobiforma nitratireducens]|uniref:Uncharacterized protein n=1 Tax=Halobiforma nitratireducens JCM 10879 TaxID=1227454 RepID=M0MA69_9EURY|nr:hypothetical protein [Halobiforma nitratireducens]EMA42248.1 hypothetical protein C446_04375 [Halobiforma nitratireducens JCM 10879]
METDNNTDDRSFEDELERIVLAAFARGDPVEGQWTIDVPVSSAPDWTITVEKRSPKTHSNQNHDPTLLDD